MANMLTLSRLILIPLFLYFMFSFPAHSLIAAIIFGLAALTDSLDGYVARRFDQVTEVGKIIDPLVDRVFIITAIIALYVRDGRPPLVALIVLLGREVLVMAGFAYLKTKGKQLSVSFLGKTATAFLMTAFALLIIRLEIALLLLYLGTALYIISACLYLWEGIQATFDKTLDTGHKKTRQINQKKI